MSKKNIKEHICAFVVFSACIAISVVLLIKPKDKNEVLFTENYADSPLINPNDIDTTTISNNHPTDAPSNNVSVYWVPAASLTQKRSSHEGVLLANGKVLVGGGLINPYTITKTSELYSLSTGWQAGSIMNNARFYYTLTPFANNTKALATGSLYPPDQKTAEVYDSINNTWTSTSTNMSYGRYLHGAVLLKNEQILIIGGKNNSGYVTPTTELYIPSTNSFINTKSMNTDRFLFTSTLLKDGSTVLVTGGGDTNNIMASTAELYLSGSWIFTNNPMTQPRAYHSAVLLQNGNVLIAGGGNGLLASYSTAEIYNTTTRTFRPVQSMKYRRASFTLTLLPSGQVLATGGIDWQTYTYPRISELYDPITETWSTTRMLNNGRSFHRSILLNDSVLTIGGYNMAYDQIASCEKFQF